MTWRGSGCGDGPLPVRGCRCHVCGHEYDWPVGAPPEGDWPDGRVAFNCNAFAPDTHTNDEVRTAYVLLTVGRGS